MIEYRLNAWIFCCRGGVDLHRHCSRTESILRSDLGYDDAWIQSWQAVGSSWGLSCALDNKLEYVDIKGSLNYRESVKWVQPPHPHNLFLIVSLRAPLQLTDAPETLCAGDWAKGVSQTSGNVYWLLRFSSLPESSSTAFWRLQGCFAEKPGVFL